jgi:hypothetical protein
VALKLEVVPEKAVVIRRGESIVAASWFGPAVLRPYVYPFLGPGDVELTRLGHPLDPVGHSHHRSIWMGHHDVAGANFWEEAAGAGRIEQRAATVRAAEGESVSVLLDCVWRTADGKALLAEARGLTFHDLAGGELALEIDTVLQPPEEGAKPVVLGDTPFGLLGIRVARTLRVADGLGGAILNSNEGQDERGCFWQHAEWCDYSGPAPIPAPRDSKLEPGKLPAVVAGIACFNHPANSDADTLWHVRDDGWMGPCISKGAPRTIVAGAPLRARYYILAHAGHPWDARVPERHRAWRATAAKPKDEK